VEVGVRGRERSGWRGDEAEISSYFGVIWPGLIYLACEKQSATDKQGVGDEMRIQTKGPCRGGVSGICPFILI
jgi:hypothetical protein